MNCNNRVLVPTEPSDLSETPRRTFFFRRPAQYPLAIMDMDKHMEDMERSFASMEKDMNAMFRDLDMFDKSRFPRVRTVFEPNQLGFFPGEIKEEEVMGKYSVKMDLGKVFGPENVKVTIIDRMLTIEARVEYKSNDGYSRMYQEFCKSFKIPDNVNVEEMKSCFPKGDLLIEAALL